MKLIINLLLSTIAILVSAYLVPGVVVDGFMTALVVAIVLAVVNAVIEPVVTVLTLPINILTLGLFSFVITALMILLTTWIVPGFRVDGLLTAIVFGIVLSIINWALFLFMPNVKS